MMIVVMLAAVARGEYANVKEAAVKIVKVLTKF